MSRQRKKKTADFPAENGALKLESVPLGELHEDPANARTHDDRNLAAIEASLREFGQVEPLVVLASSGRVIGGNGRLAAMKRLGWEKAYVVRFSGSETQARALAIALNRTAELAGWDGDVLAQTIEALRSDGFDVSALCISDEELRQIVEAAPSADGGETPKQKKHVEFEATVPDDDPAATSLISRAAVLQKKWKTSVGQLWEIKGVNGDRPHRLLIGDSTKPDQVARLFDGAQACLMNTDPPYGVDFAGLKKGMAGGFNTLKSTGGIENDDLTDPAELRKFLEETIRTALPHLREKTAFYLWHPMLTQGTFFAAAAAAAADILIHRQIIWVKPHLVLTRSGQYHWKHELCFYGWVRGKPPEWYGDKSQVSVWECGEPSHGRLHPSQKPVELFRRPILNHTLPGEIVYEPFAGSGSQFLAAEQTQRVCYGIELDPPFAAVVLERMRLIGADPQCSTDKVPARKSKAA